MAERIREAAGSFFISTTLINIVMYFMGMILRPGQRFGYEAFIYPVVYGALSCIPNILIASDKEMTVKQLMIRKVIKLFMIIAILRVFMFSGNEPDKEMIGLACIVSFSIIAVYVMVHVIEWLLDTRTARQMMADLVKLQDHNTYGT